MGLSVKPVGKMESVLRKVQNNLDKEKEALKKQNIKTDLKN